MSTYKFCGGTCPQCPLVPPPMNTGNIVKMHSKWQMLAMPCSQNRNLKCIRICKLPVSSSCLGTFLIIPILPYQFLHYLVIYCICTYNMCYVYTNLCMLCVFVILFYKVISNKQQMKDRKSLKLNSNVKVIDLTGKEK